MGVVAVGGHLIDAETLGRSFFSSAVDVLENNVDSEVHSGLQYILDARVMRHFSIPVKTFLMILFLSILC